MGKKEIRIPDAGTRYWYVCVNPCTSRFGVREAVWLDFSMDRIRLASGTMFLNANEAVVAMERQNDILDSMPEAKPAAKYRYEVEGLKA